MGGYWKSLLHKGSYCSITRFIRERLDPRSTLPERSHGLILTTEGQYQHGIENQLLTKADLAETKRD